jgi:iron complex transport system substrate-binding protein
MENFTPLSRIRIASFIASATEIVDALGMFDCLVGRSHECDYPPGIESLPVCTRPRIEVSGNSLEIDRQVKEKLANALSIYEVLDDVLEELQPTHILTQTQCEVCAVSLKDVERSVAARLASRPKIVSLQPNCLADIWADVWRVADVLGMPERGERTVNELLEKMRAISAGATRERPTVACIEWLSPLMAAGNWVPELVEMAGGVNLFGEAGKHSPWMTWEELVERDPDAIVAMPCGFDEARTRSEMYWLTERREYSGLKAARTGQVHAVDGNQYFNRPGPRVVESLSILTGILKAL